MKFIRRNMFTIIVVCVIGIILLLSLISIASILFPNLGKPIYGNRLDDIKAVKISGDKQIDIENTLSGDKNVNKSNVDIRGNLINIIIDIKSEVDIITAKNIALDALSYFSDDEKKVYDIEIFITKDSVKDNTLFPIIGYKNKFSTSITWTRKE